MMKRYVKFAKLPSISLTLVLALIFIDVAVLQYSLAQNCADGGSKVKCSCGGCSKMLCPQDTCDICLYSNNMSCSRL